MAAPSSTTELLELVRRSGICPPATLAESLTEGADLPEDPSKTAAVLVSKGLLTRFQARLLLAGKYRGFRIGPYVIQEQIGQGGMGAVYLARHETLHRKVAIKVLSAAQGSSPLAVERFLREARAAAALDHPNIVRLYDVGRHDEAHYLVMEYVEGQTLDRLLYNTGPIACGRAVEYITQAAAGLQHAFEKGFIHRDIKPGNLMLSKDGTIKLLDMGLARSFEQSDKLTEVLDQGAVVGTADFISPEQAMNNPDLDIRADIYSLGATFFMLVTGRPPFDGNTTQKLMQHQMKEAPTLTSLDRTFPPGLAAVVATMLKKKPEERYRTPAEVIAALAPWLPGSSKVIAAITRTEVADPRLKNTLAEVVLATTQRMSSPRLATPGPVRPGWFWPAIGGGAVVVLVAAVVGGVAALGGFSSPSIPDRTKAGTGPAPVEPAPRPAGPGPSGAEAGLPASPLAAAPKLAGVTYDLGLLGRRPYAEAGTVLGDPADPKAKWRIGTKTGDGQFPPGWQPTGITPNGPYDGAVEEVGGALAIGLRTGPGSLLSPEVLVPSGSGTLTIEYRTDAGRGPVRMTFRPTRPEPTTARDAATLPATDGAWRRHGIKLDLRGATAGRFEFLTPSATGFWVRGFTVQDPAPLAGRVLSRLDSARLQPFVQRARRHQDPGSSVPIAVVAESGPGRLPPSWYRWIEYPETTAEFFADGPPGAVALGVRAVEGPGGVQVNTPEFDCPTGRCSLRLLYQTGLTSPGFIVRFRPTRPSKGTIWDAATLPATGGSWRLAQLDLDLRTATGGLFELYNGVGGADAAIRIREYVVTELE
jgi:hypothetical protein